MPSPWTVRATRLLFEGGPHRLRLDTCVTPSGVEVRDYFVREVNDIAMVFALTRDREAVLVRQYRHGIAGETLELPQGLLEDGEGFAEGGARELREETGYAAPRLERIAELWSSPAVQTNRVHVLLAEDARLAGAAEPEPEEELDVVTVPAGALLALVADGRIRAASSVAGIYLALEALRARGPDAP